MLFLYAEDQVNTPNTECLELFKEEKKLSEFQDVAALDIIDALGTMPSKEGEYYQNLRS